jgi:hypothetical protein
MNVTKTPIKVSVEIDDHHLPPAPTTAPLKPNYFGFLVVGLMGAIVGILVASSLGVARSNTDKATIQKLQNDLAWEKKQKATNAPKCQQIKQLLGEICD